MSDGANIIRAASLLMDGHALISTFHPCGRNPDEFLHCSRIIAISTLTRKIQVNLTELKELLIGERLLSAIRLDIHDNLQENLKLLNLIRIAGILGRENITGQGLLFSFALHNIAVNLTHKKLDQLLSMEVAKNGGARQAVTRLREAQIFSIPDLMKLAHARFDWEQGTQTIVEETSAWRDSLPWIYGHGGRLRRLLQWTIFRLC